MLKKIKNLTLIVPHPDDEVIGCLHLFEEKKINKVIVVTDGRIQTIKNTMNTYEYIRKRKKETLRFSKYYNVSQNNIIFLNYRDSELDNIPYKKLVNSIKGVISEDEILSLPITTDIHPDHKKVAELYKYLNNVKLLYSITSDISNSYKIDVPKLHKMKVVEDFYPSQYWRLIKSKFPFRDYEEYKLL